MHAADPTGRSNVVSSGGVLWDLYGDFPDYPALQGPTLQARLNGQNLHSTPYVQSFQQLETMLQSFGDDTDGIEADYIGWHPHMPWREIDQVFAWIKSLAGDKPIYVDDMWANIFLGADADAPGLTQFTGGGTATEGDFPNALAPTYSVLQFGTIFTDGAIRDWYYARHARHIVKAFASAFGEGAERVSVSGNADFGPVRLSPLAHIQLMGTLGEGFLEKPSYWTYKLLVEKLHDFTSVVELDVSANPRTRVYRFERPRGPIWVAWSETGGAPANLDYDIATGETVSFEVGSSTLQRTHIVDQRGETEPDVSLLPSDGGSLTIQLGYEPLLLERVGLFADGFESGTTSAWSP